VKGNSKIVIVGIVLVALVLLGAFYSSPTTLFGLRNNSSDTMRIGWISDLSGSTAKYGSYEAGMLAVDEINSQGGINGKKVELVVEDGKCDAKEALSAIDKLLDIDGLKFILGGHCTAESMAIAPVVQERGALMLAAITSSPLLSNAGDNVFRTSAVSTIQSDLLAKVAINKGLKKMAIIYIQTSYAQPVALEMKNVFTSLGGNVVLFEGFVKDTSDFRTILQKANALGADSFFFSTQTPDEAFYLLKQTKELGLTQQIFGNDQAQNATIYSRDSTLQEGMIVAAPDMNMYSEKTKSFFEAYKAKYGKEVPFGVWTAESYDGVFIMAQAIEKYDGNVELIKKYLYSIDYEGASGRIRMDANGDGIREYKVKIMKDGKMVDLVN